MRTHRPCTTLLLLSSLACAGSPPAAQPASTAASAARVSPVPRQPDRAIVDAPDRLDTDRALDPGRRPAELLAFLGLSPGMRVAELGAGGGYTTELLARAVAPGGVVYAENPAVLLRLVGPAWGRRLERPALRDVVRVDRELDDPLPAEARGLHLVLMNAVYHDTVALKVDRARMNRAVFEALRPGGAFVVIDSSARPGSGTADAPTLHRIDEDTVRREVEAAGFRLDGSADFLRNPDDARDWNASPGAAGPRRGTSDRFVLRFVRP